MPLLKVAAPVAQQRFEPRDFVRALLELRLGERQTLPILRRLRGLAYGLPGADKVLPATERYLERALGFDQCSGVPAAVHAGGKQSALLRSSDSNQRHVRTRSSRNRPSSPSNRGNRRSPAHP